MKQQQGTRSIESRKEIRLSTRRRGTPGAGPYGTSTRGVLHSSSCLSLCCLGSAEAGSTERALAWCRGPTTQTYATDGARNRVVGVASRTSAVKLGIPSEVCAATVRVSSFPSRHFVLDVRPFLQPSEAFYDCVASDTADLVSNVADVPAITRLARPLSAFLTSRSLASLYNHSRLGHTCVNDSTFHLPTPGRI